MKVLSKNDLTRFPFHAVVMESEVVADGVCEVGGQDVRLEDVDVHGDPDRFSGANRSDCRDCRAAVFKCLPAEMIMQILIDKTIKHSKH